MANNHSELQERLWEAADAIRSNCKLTSAEEAPWSVTPRSER